MSADRGDSTGVVDAEDDVDPAERVGLVLSALDRDPADLAVRAESLGYDSVWLGELWGRATPVQLGAIAERTDDVTVAPYVPAAVDDDPDVAMDTVRGHVAYYVGSGDGYWRAVGERFPDEADDVRDASRSGDRRAAAGHVTDEMVAALGVAGTPETARDQLLEIAAMDVVDRPLVTIAGNAAALAERTMRELAPDELR